MDNKLKSCPFCGSKPKIIQRTNKLWDIGCLNLECIGWSCTDKKCSGCKDGFRVKNDVIKSWNNRKEIPNGA